MWYVDDIVKILRHTKVPCLLICLEHYVVIGKVGEGGRGADTEDDCDDERNKVGGIVCQRHRQHRPQHRQAHSLILSHGATSVSGHL